MARGVIYEIDKDPNQLFSMTEDCFYDFVDDYVSEIEDPSYSVTYLLEKCRAAGMQVGFEKFEDLEIPFFVIDRSSREKFFEAKWEKLKEEVSMLSLSDFATGRYDYWTVRYLLEDDYGDAVTCMADTLQSLDRFMREAEDGRYYIGRLFYMH